MVTHFGTFLMVKRMKSIHGSVSLKHMWLSYIQHRCVINSLIELTQERIHSIVPKLYITHLGYKYNLARINMGKEPISIPME